MTKEQTQKLNDEVFYFGWDYDPKEEEYVGAIWRIEGDQITVLSVNRAPTVKELQAWAIKATTTRAWETRH